MNVNEKIRALMERRASAMTAARAILDKADAENRDLNQDEQNQYNGFDSEIDQLTNRITREQRQLDREAEYRDASANGANNPATRNQPGATLDTGADVRSDSPVPAVQNRAMGAALSVSARNADRDPRAARTQTREYRSAVIDYLANGVGSGPLMVDRQGGETRSVLGVNIGTSTAGGVLAPTEMERTLLDFAEHYNVMRQLASVRSSASDIDIPYSTSGTTAYHIAEGADFTRTTPAWSKLTMRAYKTGALTVVTHEAMEDIFLDLESWIRDDFGIAFAELEETDFVSGTGSSQPSGVLTGATAAITAAGQTAITADELFDLQHSLKLKFRANATWLMNDATIKLLRKLKTTDNQYIWQPGLQLGSPDTLLGRPVVATSKMPAPTAGNKAIAYGDFKWYRILDRTGLYIQRLNELYATSGQVGFLAYRRYDAKLLDATAVQLLSMAAAAQGSGD